MVVYDKAGFLYIRIGRSTTLSTDGLWNRYHWRNSIGQCQKKFTPGNTPAPEQQPIQVDAEDTQPPPAPQQSTQPPTTPPIGGLHVPLPDSPMIDLLPSSPSYSPDQPPSPSPSPPAGNAVQVQPHLQCIWFLHHGHSHGQKLLQWRSSTLMTGAPWHRPLGTYPRLQGHPSGPSQSCKSLPFGMTGSIRRGGQGLHGRRAEGPGMKHCHVQVVKSTPMPNTQTPLS